MQTEIVESVRFAKIFIFLSHHRNHVACLVDVAVPMSVLHACLDLL